ncbi:MAG: hypothetical protein K0R02_914 [Rickettsiaceae bacterium]|jgi:Ran GTPase-activating protein (RanGAP) involved in mRNA processing and transport|nr:hypothetical protein [Rickettsiaceae bacterium]
MIISNLKGQTMDINKLSNLLSDINSDKLTEVKLHMQDLHKDDIKKIAEALKNCKSIISLDLSDNYLDDSLVEVIAESLISNKVVNSLDLSSNKITDKGAAHIALLIKDKNNHISKIDLGENKIEYKGAKLIAEAIIENPELTELRLEGNPLGGAKGLKTIESKLKKSNIIFYNFAPTALAEEYMDILVKEKYTALDEKKKSQLLKIFKNYASKFKFLLEKIKNYSPQKINLAFGKISNIKSLSFKKEQDN